MIKDKKVNDSMWLSYARLDNLRVVYAYEACDGEYWSEVSEVYRGADTLNLMPYLSDSVLSELEKQIVFSQGDD